MIFSANPFLQTAIVSVNVVGLWDIYLKLRQRRATQCKEIPSYFKNSYTEKEFAETQAYRTEFRTFDIFQKVKSLVIANVSTFFQLSSRLYYAVAQHTGLTIGSFTHNYTVAVTGDVIATVLEIPFSYYDNFHIEKRHGFNTMTKIEFFKDTFKSLLLRVAFLHPILIKLIQFVVRRFGERFPLYLFSGMSLMMLVFLLALPTVFMPLFNKFKPLDPASSLYNRTQKLSKMINFPLSGIFVIDGSRRSTHSNAYFYGIGRKHIVLYDTLLDQMKDDEDALIAVLCHELGHWKLGHMYMNITGLLGQLMLVCCGARFVFFNKIAYEAFGFREMDPVNGMVISFYLFENTVNTLFEYLFCFMSRRNEFQADHFAFTMGYGEAIKRGLLILMKNNRGDITVDPLYSALHHTHPPTLERLQAIDLELKKKE